MSFQRFQNTVLPNLRVAGPALSVNDAADSAASPVGKEPDGEFHRLRLIGTHGINLRGTFRDIPVHNHKRHGKALLPSPEQFSVRSDPDRSAELNALELFQIILRQNFDPVST